MNPMQSPNVGVGKDLSIDSHKRDERRRQFLFAAEKAKGILKKGDRVRVTKCPGTKRTITFDHWDGPWIVSKSGIDDYAPSTIDKLNGETVDFRR